MKLFFRVFSYLTHPIFLTSFAVSIYFLIKGDNGRISIMSDEYRSIVLNTLVFPLLTVFLLKALGWIESIYLRTQRERIIPIMASMIFYFWAYFVARHVPFDSAIQTLLLAGFTNLILLTLLGIVMKPSLHVSSWSVIALWFWYVYSVGADPLFLTATLFVMVILLLVIIARYSLEAHDDKEILGGLICGVVSMLISALLL